jgi:hypothetical protein
VGPERGPLSLASTIEKLLETKSSGSDLENEIKAVGELPLWLRDTPLSVKVGTNFADKRRSLGWYSSLAESGQGVRFFFFFANKFAFETPEIPAKQHGVNSSLVYEFFARKI